MAKERTSKSDRQIVNTETLEDFPIQRALPSGIGGSYRDVLREIEEVDEIGGGGDGENDLPPPNDIKVKSQTIRFTPEGTQVIDVVLTWEEIPGATNYEVKIMKVE